MSKFPIKNKTFKYDETIITCSADIKMYGSKVNFKNAANSTMIDKHSNRVQVSHPPVFPNISTLSVPTEVVSSSDSDHPTPDTSPMYFKRKPTKNVIQTINISESSEDESKIVRGLNENKKVILKNQENYNTSTQRAVLWSQEMYGHSLISEDVSIVDSTPPLRQQPQKLANGNKSNKGNLDPASPEKGTVCMPVNQYTKPQILCELNPLCAAAPDILDKVTPTENTKSPVVAKWIISSPFKDSSFGTSFVHEKYNIHSDDPSSPTKLVDISNQCLRSERSLADGLGESLKKSKKASYSVSKVIKSLSVSNSSDNFSGNDTNLLRRGGNIGGVVELTDEDSDDGSERISNPQRAQNVVVKNISSSKQDCADISHEDSLHLRLSEELSKSNKTNEKTVLTIGRDATSPGTLKNSPVDSPNNSSGKITRTQNSRHVRRIIDSDSENEIHFNYKDRANVSVDSETSLPDLEIQSYKTSSNPESKRISQISTGESGNIHIYSGEQRKHMGAVMKSVTKDFRKSSTRQQKFKRAVKNKVENKKDQVREVKENVKKHIVFETDSEGDSEDEDSFLCQVRETSSEEEEDYKKILKDNDTPENVPILTKEKQRALVNESFSSSESENKAENDSFELYLTNVKKQIEEKNKLYVDDKIQDKYESSFINDDSDEDDSYSLPPLTLKFSQNDVPEPAVNYKYCGSISTDHRSHKKIEKSKKIITSTSSSSWRDSPTINISSDSDEVFSVNEVRRKPTQPSLPLVTPKSKGCGKTMPKTEGNFIPVSRRYKMGGNCNVTPTLSFLASLSTNVHLGRCHPEAVVYTKNFKKSREQLSEKLYNYYNNCIFENKLPPVMNIKWNARMTKTAGFCYYQIDKSKPSGRGARIELSMKVIDSNERLRDTLIHELCHAAAWIISGYKDGHGPLWKAWASIATQRCPELPAINRCHSYEINCKYTYKCSSCSYSIGRHSKSLDTEKKVCGFCHGKFELIVNSQQGGQKGTGRGNPLEVNVAVTPANYTPKTPRPPGAFALFVKGNYGTVKKSKENLKHADVMKILSTEFGKMKAGSN
ncbi:uncharacterized protein [Procambarus clarkii]